VLIATSAGNVFRILRLAAFAGTVAGIASRVTSNDSITFFANAVGRISTLGNAGRLIAALCGYVRAELVIASLIAFANSASRTTVRTDSAGTSSRILSLAASAGTASCIATFAALADVAIRDIAAWRTALACCWIRGTLPRAPRSAARAIGTSAPRSRVNTAGTTSTLITSFAANRTYALRATACAFTSTTGALTGTAVL